MNQIISFLICIAISGLSSTAMASYDHIEKDRCQTEASLMIEEVEEKEFLNSFSTDKDSDNFLLSLECSDCELDLEDALMHETPIVSSYPMELGVGIDQLNSFQFLDETIKPI